MDKLPWLILLNLSMFISSFLSGLAPLLLTTTTKPNSKNLNIFGVGLMVGTALLIILPEGIETLYNANHGEEGVVKEKRDWGYGRFYGIDKRQGICNP